MRIGGTFEVPVNMLAKKDLNQLNEYIPKATKQKFLFNGKTSLKYIIRLMNLGKHKHFPDSFGCTTLLPSYLCEDILISFKEENARYQFYNVKKVLSIDLKDIRKKIGEAKALLVIHYFGFCQHDIKRLMKICSNNSVYLIEDVAHSFLSNKGLPLGSFGDVSFSCFRKLLPVYDGSLLSINYTFCEWKPKKIILPKMSDISRRLLNKLDLTNMIKSRRSNYQYLSDNFKGFNKLVDGICPYGFMIKSDKREIIKEKLIYNKVYPPIHWNLPEEVKEFKDSWDLSKRILTMPIDQRYNRKHMKYIIKVLTCPE